MNRPTERAMVFQCDGASLLGILHEPATRTTRTGVLVIVGGPQYRVGSHRQFVLMARQLAAAGWPVMRFDYRGMGDSDGTPRGFDTVDEDVRAATDAFMKAVPSLEGVVLWGLCDAASAAIMRCSRDRRVRGVIAANPWVRSDAAEAKSYLRHYYGQRFLQASFWRKLLSSEVNARESLRDLARKLAAAFSGPGRAGSGGYVARMLEGLRAFRGPVLVLLSERDLTARQFADLADGSGAWRKAMRRRGVSIERLGGTDHTFSDRAGLDAATSRCVEWLGVQDGTSWR